MFKYCVVIDIVIIILTQSERNSIGHSRVIIIIIIIILSGVNRLYVLYRKDFYTVRKRCLHYILSGVTQSSLISSYLMPRGPASMPSLHWTVNLIEMCVHRSSSGTLASQLITFLRDQCVTDGSRRSWQTCHIIIYDTFSQNIYCTWRIYVNE